MTKEYLGRIDLDFLKEKAENDTLSLIGIDTESIDFVKREELIEGYKKLINVKYQENIKQELDKYTPYQMNKLKYLNEVYEFNKNTMNTLWDLYCNNIHYDEVNKGKDICDFTQYEIETLIKAVPTVSYATKGNVFYFIKQYCEWAVNKGLAFENPTISIDKAVYQSVNVKALRLSRVELPDFQEKITAVTLDSSVDFDYMKAIAVLLPRYGIFGANGVYAINLRWEHVDEINKKVNIIDEETGEVITTLPVDDFFINWIDKCREYDGAVAGKPRYINNGYVLKQIAGKRRAKYGKSSYNAIREAILSFNSLTNNSFKPFSLVRDRKIDLLLELRKIRQLHSNDFKEINSLFEPNIGESSYFQLKKYYEDLFEDELYNFKSGAKKNLKYYNERNNYVRPDRRRDSEE